MVDIMALQSLVEDSKSVKISEPEQNLRSKIGNLIRSIENLEQKKARIDYEIKKQKRSLARKRIELKKDSKHLKAKHESAMSSQSENGTSRPRSQLLLLDESLLRDSARILDQ